MNAQGSCPSSQRLFSLTGLLGTRRGLEFRTRKLQQNQRQAPRQRRGTHFLLI